MATKTAKRAAAFWRSDAFLGAAVVLAVLALNAGTDLIGTLERRFYDFGVTSAQRTPSDRVAIIAIDDASIAAIGRWPWPRDVHARLIDRLAEGKAKVIGHTALFLEPQTDRGLDYIRQIKAVVEQAPADTDASGEQKARITAVIAQAETALDTDGQLAASLGRAGKVVLPSVYRLGDPLGKPDEPLPAFAKKSTVPAASTFASPAVSGQQPIALLGEQALGVGHLNQLPDVDGSIRREPLLVDYYGAAVPSIALLLAASSLNLGIADIRLDPVQSQLLMGNLRVRTDAQASMLPQFYAVRGGKPPFSIDSFNDVLTGKLPADRYAGKIVLIGSTAAGLGTSFATPVSPVMTPVEFVAHVTSSLLSEHFIVQPPWSVWAGLGALLLVAGYLTSALPRLSAGMGALATGVFFFALLAVEFGLLSRAYVWLELVLPASVLLIGHLALTTKRFLVTEAGKVRTDEESAETNRMMGLALQGQGQLDLAFDRFRRVAHSDALMDNLGNLALDFERKRQFNKAQAVYEHMVRLDPGYRDVQARLKKARNLSETVILGGGSSHPGGTLVLGDGAVEKPMLGRYQIEKELGKGAMGVVYQGRDPKIGRVVAIKTLALSQEFEGDDLIDARERFFREAETAGRLQHQNIVTIFDAGEEHDLAYIAMEFLRGRDLLDHCREGHLLPVAQVLSIGARVADALDYAHQQHVVHRDIKPANIMYDAGNDTVKVTDFGIARITDSSRTKTGLVLGTPSFMSPEQIAGRRVDGRSDLYSLGVMLFQMLTGVLPFRGDSMAELMYKIANEPAPDIRIVRPDLPEGLSRIIAHALEKDPDTRYADGARLAADLRTVIASALANGPANGSTNDDAPSARPAVQAATYPASAFEKTQIEPRDSAAGAPNVGSSARDQAP